jgi:nitroimidazol reductase NimA-like FMN-containing flavoprotein (pyridoxamine 5'-phosphate oxidase superfamily)
MSDKPASQRSTVKRLPKRAVYDRDAIHRILDEGLICHVSFVVEGQPFVIPTIYVRIGEGLYLHGSPASRMLRFIAAGGKVCITVTLVDGLVLARSAFHHSMNYRSVVLFGTGGLVEDPARKDAVLRGLSEHLITGRWQDVRWPTQEELRRTLVVSVAIEEASAKVRTGGPIDDEEDYALPIWAGVVPLRLTAGVPIDDDRVLPGVAVPGYAAGYAGPGAAPDE